MVFAGDDDREAVVLGVKEDAGLDTLGVAGLVTTFLKSSSLRPRRSLTFVTVSGSHSEDTSAMKR